MNNIDNVYLINLDKDKDRLSTSLEECKKINRIPIRIPGIYGKYLTDKELNDNVTPFYSKVGSSSAIGCAMSHIKAWKIMIENKDNIALFLEDDVLIDPNFIEIFNKNYYNIPKDFGIFYLGCSLGCNIKKNYDFGYTIGKYIIGKNKYNKKLVKITDHIYQPSLPLAMHGYILTRNTAQHLVQQFEKDKIYGHVDVQLLKYIYNIPSYTISPQLIKQQGMSLETSNNIRGTYPSIINKFLTKKDPDGIPMSYKMSISNYEIKGYNINAYTHMVVLIGVITAFLRIKLSTITIFYIIFHLLELINTSSVKDYFKNTIVTYFILTISYIITFVIIEKISNKK